MVGEGVQREALARRRSASVGDLSEAVGAQLRRGQKTSGRCAADFFLESLHLATSDDLFSLVSLIYITFLRKDLFTSSNKVIFREFY